MSATEHEHDPKEIENLWMQDQESIQNILDNGARSIIEAPSEIDRPEAKPCACIDERVGGFKIAIPGSGILYDQAGAIKLLKEAGVTSLSSHQDCGAAGIAFQKLDASEQEHYGTVENYSIEWTKKMAQELGVPYDGHKSVETPGQHIARAIYYDASGGFQADQPNYPKGFTIARRFVEPQMAQSDLELSIKIALGAHGFGSKFTNEQPLLIIPIGSDEQIDALKQEILQVVEKDPALMDVIKIDDGVLANQKAKSIAA